MKRTLTIVLCLVCAAAFADAQLTKPTTDVLGAHLNYGRGCTACHTPHSGSAGNGSSRTVDPSTGARALWGADVSGLYGKTMTTGGGKYVEVLPASMEAGTPDVEGMLTCLGCHDGNYAPKAMMKNRLYESLPMTYGNASAVPTLLGADASGGYVNSHPMGLSAKINCGGSEGWDCAEANGTISMKGAKSSQFVRNYGYFVKPANYNNNAVIVCTTCHDPHSMNVVTVNAGSSSGLPAGTYATMFFLRAPYNPNDTNPMSNQTAQFCRQCHADKSNEMNGSTAQTVF